MEPLKVIKTEQEYEAAVAALDTLMDSAATTPEFDRLEVLAVLITQYEDEHHPIGRPSPIEALTFYMAQRGLTRNDLIPFIGSRSKVSEVLSGKRPLSLSMIRALQKHFKIPADLLIQESEAELPEEEADIE